MAQTYFAAIQPGLEDAVLNEVRRLGGNRPTVVRGGVEFDAARKRLYRAHLQMATPTRIWLRVDEFRARDAPELYNKTRRFDWERLLGGEHSVYVRAHSRNSRLYHTGKIRDAVADGLRDHFAEDLGDQNPPQIVEDATDDALTVMARLEDDRCQLNLDASGERLHRRGWRTEGGDAPLRENIAAAILELIDWDPEEGLVDPMCGSGTVVVEAARKALGYAPGLDRSFALQRWRNFQPDRFKQMRAELRDSIASQMPAPIAGRDRDEELIDVASRNAERAGVADHVELSTEELTESLPGDVGWLVTNPPYGFRLDEDRILERLLDARKGSDVDSIAFLWPSQYRDQVPAYAGDAIERLTSFDNGGIAVDLWSSS